MHEEDYPSHNKDNKMVEWDSSQRTEKYDQNGDEWIPLGWMTGGWIGRMDKMNDTRMYEQAFFSNGMALEWADGFYLNVGLLAIKWLIYKIFDKQINK